MDDAIGDLLKLRGVELSKAESVTESFGFRCLGIAEKIPELQSDNSSSVYVWHISKGILPVSVAEAERWLVDVPGGAKGRKLLHLFSGPSDRSDGFAAFAKERDFGCDEFDTIIHKQLHDLADDAVWYPLFENIKGGDYEGLLAGPPAMERPSSMVLQQARSTLGGWVWGWIGSGSA